MATSIITGTITDAAGNAQASVPVRITLVPKGAFRTSTGVEVAPVYTTATNASGVWTATLERNADITPANSYYVVEEQLSVAQGGPRRHAFQVGSTNQTLFAALVTPIPDLAASTYLSQAAGDARYVLAPGSFATAGNLAETRPNDTAAAGVLSTYARGDHRHDRETTYGTAAARAALSGTDLYEGLRFRETDGSDKLYEYRAAAWLQVADALVVADNTARDAITTPYSGMLVYVTGTNRLWRYNGSAWRYVSGVDPFCAVVRTSAYSLANNTITALPLATANITELADTDAIHDGTTNTTRFTVPTGFAGRWRFTFTTSFAGNATGTRAAWFEKNRNAVSGGTRYGKREHPTNSASNETSVGATVTLELAEADYLELFLYQNSGGALNAFGNNAGDMIEAIYEGPTN